MNDGFGVEPGVWFRLALGGITGHKDFARDTGVIVKPPDATQGRRRDRARLHRAWRSHQPQQGAAEICARRLGLRQISGRGRGKARLQTHAQRRPTRSRRGPRSIALAHIGVHPQKQAGLNWIGVVLPVGKLTLRADARPRQDRARSRRRRYPPHGLAEPADLRRAGRQGRARRGRDRRARACRPRPRRSAPDSSPAPAMSAAASRPSDTKRHAEEIARMVRGARRARHAGQHSSHRLPSFLRAALHRRHRADRGEGRR